MGSFKSRKNVPASSPRPLPPAPNSDGGFEYDTEDTYVGTESSNNASQPFIQNIEDKFRHGWEKLKKLKKQSLMSKASQKKARTQEIKNFVRSGSTSKTDGIAQSTRAFTSLIQIPFLKIGVGDSEIKKRSTNKNPVPVVFSLLNLLVVNSEDTGSHIASNAIFTFDLTYKINEVRQLKWTVKRNIVDILKLHSFLAYHSFLGHFPALPTFPNQLAYIIDFTMLSISSKAKREARRLRHAQQRKDMLQSYFSELLMRIGCFYCKELAEFFEISAFDLDKHVSPTSVSWKGKEGNVLIRTYSKGASLLYSLFWMVFYFTRNTYTPKWFVIRDSYIAIFDDCESFAPIDVLLCDKDFEVVFENEFSKNPLKPVKVTAKNHHKKIEFMIEHGYIASEWIKDLNRLKQENIWRASNRFNSFAPVRQKSHFECYIDAEEYFKALCSALEQAKKEIFIHGWWVSPELFLLRPSTLYPEYRLDRLLLKKAIEGVKIYIIIYKEVTVAVSINSLYTKTAFEKLHQNILVQRHPDHFSGSLYWAHHEKIVVIDQKVAFSGGIDLCYGRFDSPAHTMTDYSSDHHKVSVNGFTWSGIDYANPLVRDFRNIHDHEVTQIDRSEVPRLPWHDVQCMVKGLAAFDIARHFIERWNFIRHSKGQNHSYRIPYLLPEPPCHAESFEKADDYRENYALQVIRSAAEWSSGVETEKSSFEAYAELIRSSKHFIYIENQFFLSKTCPESSTTIKNTIAQEIIDRIVRAHKTREPFKVLIVMPLMPAFEPQVFAASMIMQNTLSTIGKGKYSFLNVLKAKNIDPDDYVAFLSLRHHSVLNGKLVTEQIYVHSKVMIVDDIWAIVGSANINDRSMAGHRDSEVGVCVEDLDVRMDRSSGNPVKYGKNLRRLRMNLLAEHLAIDPSTSGEEFNQLRDMTSDSFFKKVIHQRAETNTRIYYDVFKCIPDNSVVTWEQYKHSLKKIINHSLIDTTAVEEDFKSSTQQQKLAQIKGRFVKFPHNFMSKEDLLTSMLSPEYFLPAEVYL